MTTRLAKLALAVAVAAALALAGCSREASDGGYRTAPLLARSDRAVAPFASTLILGLDAAQAAPANPQAKLVVKHAYTLSLPSAEIEGTQRRHIDACVRLGCTVLSTELRRSDDGRVYATASVRISPQSFDAFVKALTAPPVRVISHSQTTEDKTIPLLDVEKRLQAKTALRDRLEAMLKDPATKTTADLLAIEKQLSQIQSDIEAATAQRDYLRTITDTVQVSIDYDGLVAEVGGIDLAPLKRAARDFGDTVFVSLATLVYAVAALLPWLPVILVLGWLTRRAVRRWRVRRAG